MELLDFFWVEDFTRKYYTHTHTELAARLFPSSRRFRSKVWGLYLTWCHSRLSIRPSRTRSLLFYCFFFLTCRFYREVFHSHVCYHSHLSLSKHIRRNCRQRRIPFWFCASLLIHLYSIMYLVQVTFLFFFQIFFFFLRENVSGVVLLPSVFFWWISEQLKRERKREKKATCHVRISRPRPQHLMRGGQGWKATSFKDSFTHFGLTQTNAALCFISYPPFFCLCFEFWNVKDHLRRVAIRPDPSTKPSSWWAIDPFLFFVPRICVPSSSISAAAAFNERKK